MVQLLDGKLLAQKLKSELKDQIAKLKQETHSTLRLVSLLVGNDAGSLTYANAQKKTAVELGIDYELKTFSATISLAEIMKVINDLNKDSSVNGLMLYKPLPKHLPDQAISNAIAIDKDIEGMNVVNLGNMFLGGTKIVPCTPASVMEHIKSTGVSLRGKEAVIVGRSAIVGKPLILLLLEQDATVTVCHSATNEAKKLIDHVKRADVLIAAVGRPELIKGEWIKPNSIVIDVGINQVGDKIVGDVEFEKAKEKAAYITPVPGGVGPLTTIMLMRNCVEAFKFQRLKKDKVNV